MNDPAFIGPYTDPNITKRIPPAQVIVANPPADNSPDTGPPAYNVGFVTPISNIGTFVAQPAPPARPNSWLPGHDYYANNGDVAGGAINTGPPPPNPSAITPGQIFPSQ